MLGFALNEISLHDQKNKNKKDTARLGSMVIVRVLARGAYWGLGSRVRPGSKIAEHPSRKVHL